jgi:hypothetical protein
MIDLHRNDILKAWAKRSDRSTDPDGSWKSVLKCHLKACTAPSCYADSALAVCSECEGSGTIRVCSNGANGYYDTTGRTGRIDTCKKCSGTGQKTYRRPE